MKIYSILIILFVSTSALAQAQDGALYGSDGTLFVTAFVDRSNKDNSMAMEIGGDAAKDIYNFLNIESSIGSGNAAHFLKSRTGENVQCFAETLKESTTYSCYLNMLANGKFWQKNKAIKE